MSSNMSAALILFSSEFDDLLELMARQDDGSQAFSWSSLGKIFNIFSDGASAVSAGANAVNTVQNQQSKR